MNAQVNKTPTNADIPASAFNTKVKGVIDGISNSEKSLVSLLSVACVRWFTTDKGGCDVIANFVNAISDYPIKQKAAVKVFSKLLPFVVITLDEEGKATADNSVKLSAVEESKRKEQIAIIESFNAIAFPSLEKAAKDEPKQPKEKVYNHERASKKAIKNVSAFVIAAAKEGKNYQKVLDEVIAQLAALKSSTSFEDEVEKALNPSQEAPQEPQAQQEGSKAA